MQVKQVQIQPDGSTFFLHNLFLLLYINKSVKNPKKEVHVNNVLNYTCKMHSNLGLKAPSSKFLAVAWSAEIPRVCWAQIALLWTKRITFVHSSSVAKSEEY